MAEDGDYATPPVRLMNFVSQEELDRAKETRGERVEDGTAQRDRPLYEILRENKEKKDAEFNERFKHRPPKALDEDEMEFLDKLEMSRKEYERQVANEEEEELQSFRKLVAEKSTVVRELKEVPSLPKHEELKPSEKKNSHARPLGGLIISVKPQAKKAKAETTSKQPPDSGLGRGEEKPTDVAKGGLGTLVSYSDESEEE
ncbi:hypothetical protein Taro_026974 [Colocasia esculenta]|uniref:FAM192A/Fyv6 N-terminal domain-containing protein n=1 Tax=Colocasia esculenta TaxID=4460 RepID=A0A843V7I8_COLES|nr:hypothetical protein [Colocasia esculenta]